MTKMSDKYFQWSLDISFFVGYTDYLPDVHRKLFVAYTNDYQQKTGLSKASYVWSLGGGNRALELQYNNWGDKTWDRNSKPSYGSKHP